LTNTPGDSRTYYALVGWFVLYFQFDVLAATRLNFGTLWLATGLILASPVSQNGVERADTYWRMRHAIRAVA